MARLPDRLDAGAVELRRWSPDVVDEVLAAVTASFAALHRWMPWAATPPTREQQLDVLRVGSDAFDRDEEWGYLMREPGTGELVGGCGLHPRIGPGGLEIGYWVRSDRTGRGYATAAARALAAAAFAFLPEVERVEIHMDKANGASAAVPAKLGYELVGEEERERLTPGQSGIGLVWRMRRPPTRCAPPPRS